MDIKQQVEEFIKALEKQPRLTRDSKKLMEHIATELKKLGLKKVKVFHSNEDDAYIKDKYTITCWTKLPNEKFHVEILFLPDKRAA